MRKPLHKHIAHHVKKFHGHFTKYLYERDTIFATAWVFIFIILVKILPLPNMHFFDPMKLALEDFDINDITYSKLKGPDKFDKRIVIINIGRADREGLAYIIEKTASMGPKVIGLDAYFEGLKDPYKDSLLRSAFEKTKNLVTISRIEWDHHGEGRFIKDYYDSAHSLTGYGNITGEEGGTIRNFSPYEKIDDSIHYSFAAMLVKQYSTEAFKKLKKRHDHNEIINYTRRNNQYLSFTGEQLLNNDVDDSALKGKIVLLGYLGEDENDIEDKVFTPTNEKFAGKSRPDMNGIVVHANIISMILDHNYIKKLPSWVNIVVAILIGWLHMSFFIRYYLENHIWFHLVAKFAQLLSAIFFVYIGIFLFDKFNMKLDMTLTLVVIILAVDIIYFYEAFAVWMHKKFGYTTVFHQQHH
ncbi:MAG TPA: CHASE2 domain-containing protein [Chitinophagaceae bacterium]|nr:CHASE2 domain-containing protein [Chitinophagaceae bacterium]